MSSSAIVRACCAALILLAACAGAQAQTRAEAQNMALVGYHDLQGRSAYQPVIHRQGGRWIAYIGLHGGNLPNALSGKTEASGTAILDVTDPKAPRLLAHIPGEAGAGEAGGAQMVRVCDGATLPHADKGKVYLLRPLGNSAQEVWDVSEPAKPLLVTTIVSGLRGTHKSWWECDTGIAYLVDGAPGWRTSRMTQIYDLSNPAKPVFIRDFGLPGQQPGASGSVPTSLHGPISTGPKGNRVYFGYGTGSGGILQIVDRGKLLSGPKEATAENLLAPQIGRYDLGPDYGAHTAFPLLGIEVGGKKRDFVAVVDESIAENCREPRQHLWMVEVTNEAKPALVAQWTADEKSGNFCSRGGRFGTHSSNENFTPIYYGKVLFLAHFNAGVRALDVRDPTQPKEIGYYIPAATDKTDQRCVRGDAGKERCSRVIQTNNVEVDDRGYIYIVDRAHTGLHILELSGQARSR